MEQTELLETAPRPEPLEQPIIFEPDVPPPAWYRYATPVGVMLTSLAVAVVCAVMILDASVLSRVLGIAALILYALYAARWFYHYARSRKLVTTRAVLTDDALEVECPAWTKRFACSEIVFTSSYSSSTNLCIIAATEDDYLSISCSCGYLIARDGKELMRPFYALNKRLMVRNPLHINYVRNKRYRRKNPFRVPLFVFEVEYDTPRTTALIRTLREKYRTSLLEPEQPS